MARSRATEITLAMVRSYLCMEVYNRITDEFRQPTGERVVELLLDGAPSVKQSFHVVLGIPGSRALAVCGGFEIPLGVIPASLPARHIHERQPITFRSFLADFERAAHLLEPSFRDSNGPGPTASAKLRRMLSDQATYFWQASDLRFTLWWSRVFKPLAGPPADFAPSAEVYFARLPRLIAPVTAAPRVAGSARSMEPETPAPLIRFDRWLALDPPSAR